MQTGQTGSDRNRRLLPVVTATDAPNRWTAPEAGRNAAAHAAEQQRALQLPVDSAKIALQNDRNMLNCKWKSVLLRFWRQGSIQPKHFYHISEVYFYETF